MLWDSVQGSIGFFHRVSDYISYTIKNHDITYASMIIIFNGLIIKYNKNKFYRFR